MICKKNIYIYIYYIRIYEYVMNMIIYVSPGWRSDGIDLDIGGVTSHGTPQDSKT